MSHHKPSEAGATVLQAIVTGEKQDGGWSVPVPTAISRDAIVGDFPDSQDKAECQCHGCHVRRTWHAPKGAIVVKPGNWADSEDARKARSVNYV